MVGILEDLQMTLFVLENKMPLFFKGASNIYFNELKGMQYLFAFLGVQAKADASNSLIIQAED